MSNTEATPTSLQDIQLKILELQKRADQIKKEQCAVVIAEIKEKMSAFGITMEDLSGNAPKKTKASESSRSVPIKYRGADPTQMWSGRGLKPRWIREAIEKDGRTLADFEVKTEQPVTAE